MLLKIPTDFHEEPPFSGAIGAQYLYKKLSVLGSEAFLQPTKTWDAALFAFEEYQASPLPLRLQAGARVEYNRVNIASDNLALTSLEPGDAQSRDFVPVSAAASAIYDLSASTNAAFTLRYSERAPTAEEQFARGPHDATFQYLVGDPNLGKERVLGLDLTLRKKTGVVTGSIGGYYNHFFNFIDFSSTGEIEDGLTVFNYANKRANFFGGEALAAYHFLPLEITAQAGRAGDGKTAKEMITGQSGGQEPNPHDLYLELRTDYVQGENRSDGRPLPRIPPWRYSAALVYQGPGWSARVEGLRVQAQNEVSEYETTTGGYTFLNASLSYTFTSHAGAWEAYVRGTNLTNELARDHSSFLNEVAPLPGRSVLVGLRYTF